MLQESVAAVINTIVDTQQFSQHKQHVDYYTVSQKIHHRVFVVTSPNINQFSKFFHWHTLRKICIKAVIEDPTTAEMHSYPAL